MARATFTPRAPNILGGLAQLKQLQLQESGQSLQRERLEFAQAESENREAVRVEAEQRKLDDNERESLEQALVKTDNPVAIRSIGDRLNSLNKKTFGALYPDLDVERLATSAETKKQFSTDMTGYTTIRRELGPEDQSVIAVGDAIRLKHFKTPGAAGQIAAVAAPTAAEAFATEKTQRKELGAQEVEQKVDLAKQTLKLTVESKKTQEDETKKAFRDSIKKSTLPQKTKDILLLDLGVGITSQLLPDRNAENAKRVQAIKLLSSQLNQANDATGELLLSGDERTKVQSQHDELVGKLLKDLGIGEERSSEGTGAVNQFNFKTPTELFTTLEGFGEQGELNPATYIQSLQADDRNKDTNGKLKLSDVEIVQGYINALQIAKGSPPVFLGGSPPEPQTQEQILKVEQEPQKALRIR